MLSLRFAARFCSYEGSVPEHRPTCIVRPCHFTILAASVESYEEVMVTSGACLTLYHTRDTYFDPKYGQVAPHRSSHREASRFDKKLVDLFRHFLSCRSSICLDGSYVQCLDFGERDSESSVRAASGNCQYPTRVATATSLNARG